VSAPMSGVCHQMVTAGRGLDLGAMNLRLPASGLLLESLLGRLGASPMDAAGATTVERPTEAQIVEAIEAMAQGHIECVILEDGDRFLQAAGDGAGPYVLQYSPGGMEAMLQVPGGVDAGMMRTVLLAYARGDLGWRGALGWAPM
jgi:hypothetical protein